MGPRREFRLAHWEFWCQGAVLKVLGIVPIYEEVEMFNRSSFALVLFVGVAAAMAAPADGAIRSDQQIYGAPPTKVRKPAQSSFQVGGETVEGWEGDFLPDRPGMEKVYASTGSELCLADASGKNLDCVGDETFKSSGGILLLDEISEVTLDEKSKRYSVHASFMVESMGDESERVDAFTAVCTVKAGKLSCQK